ncbi:hypothetical protein A1O3_01091 [Capronia epimyces CBS 606.96]|uniref:BZIP domain-containing protein n=1 Tax=Capronia epimyces CBS 606.96 TaxID=1182542 RepID=W9ZDE3_9EURO|nr:uncharacterized protein A1O3_01091 [Capronia epimyces CBS 606.96]EXJ92539.1 hypothetical protein A1O3_01091 [Capronia epimyces CBS 606.96]
MQNDPSNTSSPADNLSPASPTQASRKRKAPSGSRGVASLTPDQLAKKRANDREAQRAIRERTKQHIEHLERRIQELTSQQPYQELQAVIRQKDAIQAENDEIRRRLASIMSILQPIVGAQGLTDLATAAQHNVQPGAGQQSAEFRPSNIPPSDPYLNGRQQFPVSPNTSQATMEGSTYPPPFGADDQADGRVWSASREALVHQRDNLQRGLELNDSGERLSFNFLLDSLGQRTGNSIASQAQNISPGRRSVYPSLSEQSPPLPPWTALPKNVPPTCPLDGLLSNFLQSRRREANVNQASNANPLLNPTSYPSVSLLLNPAGGHQLDPLSQLMTDIISKFPNISGLPEQAGVLFIMFLHLRWQINPTQENYERLPDWIRPTPTQLFTPHPVWIDHLPWPRMRDLLCASYHDYPFENWFIPFTSGLSVNWPYDPADCLLVTSDRDRVDPIINPVFERHVRRLENWSLGRSFAETFPSLADSALIKRKGLSSVSPAQENPASLSSAVS